MKTIHMLIGSPRSGKSTYRRETLKEFPCVCLDDIRLNVFNERFNLKHEKAVWDIAETQFNILLEYYDNIVIDATNMTCKNRRLFLQDPLNTEYRHIAYIFTTPKALCIERAKATNQADLIPVIERMHKNYQPPSEVEFDVIYSINEYNQVSIIHHVNRES